MQGFERINDDLKFFVIDLDQFNRISGDVTVGGDDKGDFLSLEQDFSVSQNHLLVAS